MTTPSMVRALEHARGCVHAEILRLEAELEEARGTLAQLAAMQLGPALSGGPELRPLRPLRELAPRRVTVEGVPLPEQLLRVAILTCLSGQSEYRLARLLHVETMDIWILLQGLRPGATEWGSDRPAEWPAGEKLEAMEDGLVRALVKKRQVRIDAALSLLYPIGSREREPVPAVPRKFDARGAWLFVLLRLSHLHLQWGRLPERTGVSLDELRSVMEARSTGVVGPAGERLVEVMMARIGDRLPYHFGLIGFLESLGPRENGDV